MKQKKIKRRLGYNKGEAFFKFVFRTGKEHGYKGVRILIYFFRRPLNYFFHLFAQNLPVSRVRIFFHKIRGVKISRKVQIGMQVWIDESFPNYVSIEESASIAIGCRVIAHSIPHVFHEDRFESYVSPVLIKEGAWIGMNSIILPGVTIGKGSVVSVGSVVTKDVPPFTVVRGNPAEIVGKVRMKPEEKEKTKNNNAMYNPQNSKTRK